MFSLTTRQISILKYILHENESVTMSSIADHLDIPKRSVRYDLDRVEAFLLTQQIPISRIRGRGIEIFASENRKRELLADFVNPPLNQIILSPDERLELVIFMLLDSAEPLVIKELQAKLGVSRFTILGDLERSEEWLNSHGLVLIRKPGFGFQIKERCIARCNALVTFLLEVVGVMPTLALCMGSQSRFMLRMQDRVHLTNELQYFFSGLDIEYCSSIISSIQIFNNIKFTDQSYISMVINLAMQIKRIREGGKEIEISYEQDFDEGDLCRQIIKKVEQRYKITYSDAEKKYLSAQLNTAKYSRSIREIMGENSANEFNKETVEIVNQMISLVSEYIHPYLRIDRELERSLLFHLDPVIKKLRLGLPVQNPVLREVKKRYEYIFEVARRASAILEAKIHKPVSEEEIGFLAMHFAAAVERMRPFPPIQKKVLVVCGEGVATAWLLVSRLKAELPNIEVVEVLSAQDVRKKAGIPGNIDAIISTLPLEIVNTVCIVVNPFLRIDDVIAIRKALGVPSFSYQNNKVEPESLPASKGSISIKDLLSETTVAVNVKAENWKAVIDSAVGLLVDACLVEPAFTQSIKDLILEHGPYMVVWPGISLLHGPPNGGVRQTCLSLITLDPPVSFGKVENDPVDIVLTLGTVDNLSHRRVLTEINSIVNSPETLMAIRKATEKSQVLEAVQNAIERSET